MKISLGLNSIRKYLIKHVKILVPVCAIIIVTLFVWFFLTMGNSKYQFELGEQEYSILMRVDDNKLKNFDEKPRTFSYYGEAPVNWKHDFWNIFLEDSDNDAELLYLIDEINALAKKTGENPIELTIAFIQGSIKYDHEKAKATDSKVQYPFETLQLKKGVCSDMSLLLAKLLLLNDYRVVLFSFPKMNHMALGISVPKGFDNLNSGYSYVETTSYNPIGNVPDSIMGEPFNEQPDLIFPNSNGEKSFWEIAYIRNKYQYFKEMYGDNYLFCSAKKKRVLKKMKKQKDIVDSLSIQYDSKCKGSLPTELYDSCVKLHSEINVATQEYNALVQLYNE